MRENQIVRFGREKEQQVKDFFNKRKWKSNRLQLRGHGETIVHYSSAIVTIISHAQKYSVVALRYGEEKEPRFLVGFRLKLASRGYDTLLFIALARRGLY